jgi:ribosomal protein S17
MIKHEINRYSQPTKVWKNENYPVTHYSRQKEMSKLEYALHIKNLDYQVGDLVAPITIQHRPYSKWEVYKLISIDEVHRFVTFTEQGGPHCLTLQTVTGTELPYKGGTRQYRRIFIWEVPEEWKGESIVDI